MANGDYEITYDSIEPVIMLVSGNRPSDGFRLFYTIKGLGQFSVDMEKSKFSAEAIREKAQNEAKDLIKTLKG